ncbi:MAG: Do family serine endopeptidase [Rickettsiaceae bacterium]|nr:Do family serine endopeptidase [Rickettsiaceae bacterium]
MQNILVSFYSKVYHKIYHKNLSLFFRGLLCILFCSYVNLTRAESGPINYSIADIVEPLMPAVVNINTIKYQNKKLHRENLLPDEMKNHPFGEFFEHFGFPFFMDEMPTNPKAISLGSGFIISPDGDIVTNHHVIAEADEITVRLNNNKEFKAKIIGSDPKTDIALLKITSKDALPYVKFGDSSKSRVGDLAIAIGNPFGLGGTVTSGIISSKSRDIDIISGGLIDDYIQTDAPINSGNSGGPMFNVKGEVIGVNTAILTPSGTNIGIGFAIPSKTANNIVEQLKHGGKIERSKLGIRIQELTPEISEGLGLSTQKGVIIAGVDEGGAGEKAGLRTSDIVVEYNGQEVHSVRKLQILVAETPINRSVKIKIIRDGKQKLIDAKTEELTDLTENSNDKRKLKKNSDNSPRNLVINNVEFEDTEVQDHHNKGEIKTHVRVSANKSRDYWRNLQKGDIVSKVNQISIKNLADLKEEYDRTINQGKKHIVFLVKRESMTIYLALPLPN